MSGVLAASCAGGGVNYTAETKALLARMSTQPTQQRAKTIDTLIRGLQTNGFWAKMSGFWALAAHSQQAARLNWKNPSGSAITGTMAFTVDTGFTGDGANALDTNFNDSADSIVLQDSASYGCWVNDDKVETKCAIGGCGGKVLIYPRVSGDTAGIRIHDGVTVFNNGAQLNGSGFFAVDRSAVNARNLYYNGVSAISDASASAARVSDTFKLLAYDASGTTGTTRTLSIAFAGASLSSSAHATLFGLIKSYLGAIGYIPVIDLFFVVGQSNALQGSAGAPAVVNAWNYGGVSVNSWGALSTTGYSASHTAFTGTLWPSFCNTWYAATGRVPAIVNSALGGTSLLAAADGGAGNWSSTGTLRSSALSALNGAISSTTITASINSSRIILIQGEQDAMRIDGTTVTGALYQAALPDLWAYFSGQVPTLAEMCIIQSGNYNPSGTGYDAGFAAIRQAQNDACKASSSLRLIDTEAQNFVSLGYMADTVHWSQTGYNLVGPTAANNCLLGTELAA